MKFEEQEIVDNTSKEVVIEESNDNNETKPMLNYDNIKS